MRVRRIPTLLTALLGLALLASSSRAEALCAEHPFSSLPSRLAHVAEPAPLLMLGGAIAAPLVMAPTGADQHLRVLFQDPLGGKYDAERMSVVAPYALAAALAVGYASATLVNDCATTGLAARSLQAMGLAFITMTISKYVVGRTYPAGNPYAEDRLVDDGRSRRFAPFDSAGSWPSGHAATTFAFAAAVRTTLPARFGWLRYSGYLLATAVSFGMLYGDHHWASDVISGALIGEAFGRSVGAPSAPQNRISLVPSGLGLALVGSL